MLVLSAYVTRGVHEAPDPSFFSFPRCWQRTDGDKDRICRSAEIHCSTYRAKLARKFRTRNVGSRLPLFLTFRGKEKAKGWGGGRDKEKDWREEKGDAELRCIVPTFLLFVKGPWYVVKGLRSELDRRPSSGRRKEAKGHGIVVGGRMKEGATDFS